MVNNDHLHEVQLLIANKHRLYKFDTVWCELRLTVLFLLFCT
jgi:hypothetical protein